MKRGFPRPRTFVDITSSNPYKGTRGRYRRKWENRFYPHPYTASDDNVASIHEGRLKESVTFKLCGTCGEPVEDELVGLILFNTNSRAGFKYTDWITSETGPYHLKCLSLNFAMCPHLSDTKLYMPAVGNWTDVKPLVYNKLRNK